MVLSHSNASAMHKGSEVQKNQLPIWSSFIAAIVILSMVTGSISLAYAQPKETKDDDIIQAIGNRLYEDEAVSAHLIDVQSDKGIVTLSGSVDNLLSRDQAVRIAESTRGVRSVIDKISVIPVARSDEAIRKDVEKALRFDPATDAHKIKVNVTDGIVTLNGEEKIWSEKQLVAEVAKGVKGVKEIKNQIKLNYGMNRASDREIKNEVERRIALDPYLIGTFIKVEVKDGHVVLKGTVGSPWDQIHAVDDGWVTGVDTVNARRLKIEQWEKDKMRRETRYIGRSDDELKKAIRDAFRYDPRVSPFTIDTRVDDGIVTLCGVVNNLKAKRAATQDASDTTGVWRVKNYLKVRPVNAPSDSEIAKNIHDALSWDPILEFDDIKVRVRNEKVYLDGTVYSSFERQYAEDVASRIPGVVDIKNNLMVNAAPTMKNDVELKKDIEYNLLWNSLVEKDNISVSVEDGVVTLSGTVGSRQEINAAVESAFKAGARTVRGRLQVKGAPPEMYYFEYKHPNYYAGYPLYPHH